MECIDISIGYLYASEAAAVWTFSVDDVAGLDGFAAAFVGFLDIPAPLAGKRHDPAYHFRE